MYGRRTGLETPGTSGGSHLREEDDLDGEKALSEAGRVALCPHFYVDQGFLVRVLEHLQELK